MGDSSEWRSKTAIAKAVTLQLKSSIDNKFKMLFLCLLTVLGLALADTEFLNSVASECQIEIPQYFNSSDLPLVKKIGADCVMFLSDLEEVNAREFCRAWKAEYSEFFLSRSDSDNASRHSLPVCLLSRETPSQGLIISGGYPRDSASQSVEVYVPSTGQHCQLPDLPDRRYWHTMEKMTVCGGGDTLTSCLTLTDAGWEVTTTLLEWRYRHSSWDSPAGVILMGGFRSGRNTEKIQQDGSTTASFKLKFTLSTEEACAINLGTSVILTGGYYYPTRVTEYNEAGWVRDLPDLLQGRWNHGCSYYNNKEGSQTLLVTGGQTGSYDYLSSTELLVGTASAWVNTGELPSPRLGLRGANIDNRVIMTGGYNYDDILEFGPLTGQWKLVDRMIQARSYHAVSTITFESELCV